MKMVPKDGIVLVKEGDRERGSVSHHLTTLSFVTNFLCLLWWDEEAWC